MAVAVAVLVDCHFDKEFFDESSVHGQNIATILQLNEFEIKAK